MRSHRRIHITRLDCDDGYILEVKAIPKSLQVDAGPALRRGIDQISAFSPITRDGGDDRDFTSIQTLKIRRKVREQ